uniref:RING-type domain-containing protein n=1 Tax=Caenorhabditis japonica TaxID=281687 RepID=A0A8R1HXP1_CAEJA
MGQIVSVFRGRNTHVRGNQHDEEDPEAQLTFSNSSGSYFGSHFLMCGCKFEVTRPEAYLFGENSDLDQLGSRALNFPYPPGPLGNDEIRPLNLLVNIRKESVKFQRVKKDNGDLDANLYQLTFVFDCDSACVIQVHFHAKEVYQDGELQFSFRNRRGQSSEQFSFETGADQVFGAYVFDASRWDPNELSYTSGLYYPFVISITSSGVESVQMQSTMCTIETGNDNSKALVLKPLRQKIACDGVTYLLQEIFGIENKGSENYEDDSGLECIICLSDIRDTVILPCRHLCVCSNCADSLRYKHNNCPICRSPFRALIRLRAHRQTRNQIYETISLVEGLNGTAVIPSIADPATTINSSTRRKRHSSRRSNKAMNQVLTMDQLEGENVSAECIEMTYLAQEHTGDDIDEEELEIELRKEARASLEESEGGSTGSSRHTFPAHQESIESENENENENENSKFPKKNMEIAKELEESEGNTDKEVEEDEEEEEEDNDSEDQNDFKSEKRRSLQLGSRNSSSQLLEQKNKN